MNFKDQLKKDLDIFFNLDEFGEIHELDGQTISIIIDEDNSDQYSGTTEMENTVQGVYESICTIYVKSSDYKKPSIGYRLNLDKKNYVVINSNEQSGVLKIELGSFES